MTAKYAGDTSVDPTIAATMPNLKGHGTLANLYVARSRETSSDAARPRRSRRHTPSIARQIGILLAA
jgi:hypothetical protein